jgi:hypothetical protein
MSKKGNPYYKIIKLIFTTFIMFGIFYLFYLSLGFELGIILILAFMHSNNLLINSKNE